MNPRGLEGGAGRLGSAWWRRGPLITPDANTVAHVIWRNGALVDTKGNSWTMNGTVPQVASSGSTPPSAGPYTGVNFYSLGAGADVLDFAGGTFSAAVVGQITSLPASSAPLIDNGAPVSSGWLFHLNNTGTVLVACYNGGAFSTSTANAVVAGQTFVAFAGMTAGTLYAKLNGGVMTSAAGTMTTPTTVVAALGWSAATSRNYTGTIYEAWASTTAPSDALFTTILGQVNSRLRRSL
jgi:hypothetical protein